MLLTKGFNAECKRTIIFIAILPCILYTIRVIIILQVSAMVKKVEELIKIVGKGNLLEALFICMGSFQHDGARDDCSIDRRNHLGISIFAKKSREEHLDHYLNLKFSLQGLLLIYNKAYVLLSKDRELSVKEVIDEIYKVVKKSELKKDLGEMADDKKLDTFNTLINPRGEKVLKTEKDFEDQIIKDVKDVLETSNIKDPDLYNKVIDYYYSIHEINVNKNITLLFSSAKMFQHLFSTENDQTVSIDPYSCMYFYVLAGMLSVIEPGKNGLAVLGQLFLIFFIWIVIGQHYLLIIIVNVLKIFILIHRTVHTIKICHIIFQKSYSKIKIGLNLKG